MESKLCERQISAISQACMTACAKLHSLNTAKTAEPAKLITSNCGSMETQYQLFAKLKSNPDFAVDRLDRADWDLLNTCEVGVLYAIMLHTAGEFVKAMEKDEDARNLALTSEGLPPCVADGRDSTCAAAATLQHQIILTLLEKVFRQKNGVERLRVILTRSIPQFWDVIFSV